MKEYYSDIIKKVDSNYRTMKSMRPLPQDSVNYFVNEMGITVTHSSNALEGNTFTFDETRLLLEKGITSSARSFREHQDIVGYKQGFDFIYSALKERKTIDEAFIKTLHSYVLSGSNEAGKYRTIQNYVGSLTKVVYTPCPPSQVPSEMEAYISDLQNDLEKYADLRGQQNINWEELFHTLAKHHIEFEKIHPFIDGNGRTARSLIYWYLLQKGYWLTEYLSISRIIYKNKSQYEKSFLYTEYDNLDLSYFILYNLKTMKQAYEELKVYLDHKTSQQNSIIQYRFIPGINERQAQILKIISENSSSVLTAKELSSRFAVSMRTARTDLQLLVEKGFLMELPLNKRLIGYIKSGEFENLILKN